MNPFAPAPTVREVTTEDGTVLLDVDQGRFYGLNPTGTTVWQLLAQGRSIEQITGDLAARFDAHPDRIRGDVDTIVTQLRDRSLLHTGKS
jgi:outer membrane protein assembly factor BamB